MSALPSLRISAWLWVAAEWAWRCGVEGVGAFKIRGDQALRSKAPTMDHPMCGSGARWCARADAMFDVPRMHVLAVMVDEKDRLVLTVESDQVEQGCPSCGVLAVGHGRRVHLLHDAPCFGRVTLVRWLKRIWRCREPMCTTATFSEEHDLAPARAVLTTRSVAWATAALSHGRHHRVGAGPPSRRGLAHLLG